MPRARVNDLEIQYDTCGDPAGEPILLIHGLGAQLIQWSDAFKQALVERGFFVIVYDNRDVGQSTRFSDWGPADIPAAFKQARAKEPVNAPYKLEDMASDAAALLTELGIEKAHVLGMSNGGAIAQLFAILYPERTASLVSMSATSGRRGLPRATPEADAWLATSAARASRGMKPRSGKQRHAPSTAPSIPKATAGICSPASPPAMRGHRGSWRSLRRRSSFTAPKTRSSGSAVPRT
ncbi:MAG: alpha/beta hydrolase [Gammaproteobacteria bacterium]